MKNQSLGVRSLRRVFAVSCAMALSACSSEADTGEMNNNVAMAGVGGAGGIGGVGGAAGTIAPGGAGGTAGMMIVAGAGGAGGVGGAGGTGGTGGINDMGGAGGIGGMAAGMGGVGGDVGGAGGMEMAGMGGEGGGVSGEGGMGGAAGMDKGEGDGSDVITIGDSYMRLNPLEGVEVSLEKVSGRDYRNYGVAGTQVLDGRIPGQLTSAIRENPNIKTVVMTGGGNDILLGNIFCTVTWTESCNDTVRETTDAIFAMRETMAEAGVEDFIYVGYGYQPGSVTKPGLDLSRQLWMEGCSESDTPRCYFVDNVVELEGKIRSDGIHPNAEGYDIIGTKVWNLMQEKGLRR